MSPSRLLYVTLLSTVLCGLTLGHVLSPSAVACRFSRTIRAALRSSLLHQTTHCGQRKLSASYRGDSGILLDIPHGVNPFHRARLLAPVLARFRDTLLREANRQSSGELQDCLEGYQDELTSLASTLSSFVTEFKESIRTHQPIYEPSPTVDSRVTQALADYAERAASPLETVDFNPAYWRLLLLDLNFATRDLKFVGRLLRSTCSE